MRERLCNGEVYHICTTFVPRFSQIMVFLAVSYTDESVSFLPSKAQKYPPVQRRRGGNFFLWKSTSATPNRRNQLAFISVETIAAQWFQSLSFHCRVFLRGAGDGMLLVGHHGLDQLHGAAQAQIAGIQAEVVAAHRSPLLGGMRLFWPLRLRAAITPAL